MVEPQPPPTLSQPEPDISGRRLGDYQLLRRLGRGGMADVYLAEQMSLRRQVAIKILKSRLAGDPSCVQRFHHEAQAAASLVHANIVQIYEVGCLDRVHFIAQEYVPGRNLKQILDRHGPVDAATAAMILRQTAAALHKAAERGIVHRDIKPENILLTASGEAKVADFGLARVATDSGAVGLTQTGVTMGTPLYMSPEQTEGKPVDHRSDLYSLGVTCFQMLTGRPPFVGETALAVAVQHLKDEPPSLEQLRPDLPPPLMRIVHRLLAKRPEERFQQPADLLRELRALRISEREGAGWEPGEPGEEDWEAPELLALAEARLAATRTLATVMQAQAERSRRAAWLAPAVFLVPLALVLGGLAGWMSGSGWLLAIDPEEREQVEQKETPLDQYFHAVWLRTEDGFRAVWEYFPPEEHPQNAYWANQSKTGLAELYYDRERYDEALELYEELARLGASEPQLATVGYFGQANVFAAQQQLSEARARLTPMFTDQQLRASLLEGEWLNELVDEQLHQALRWQFRQWLQNYQPQSAGRDGVAAAR